MNLKKIIYIIILPTLLLINSCAKDSNFIEYLNTQVYQCDFDNYEDFIFEDKNNDNYTWEDDYEDDGHANCIMYNASNYSNKNADDWAFTPNGEIYLEANNVYNLSFYTKCSDNYYSERIEIKCGQNSSSSSMSINIMEATTINSESWEKHANSFSVTSSGYYYIGFHAVSYAKKRQLFIDNIKIIKINK